jgi:hypothetical protein
MQDFLHLPIPILLMPLLTPELWTPRDAIYKSHDLPPRSMNGNYNWSMIVMCGQKCSSKFA